MQTNPTINLMASASVLYSLLPFLLILLLQTNQISSAKFGERYHECDWLGRPNFPSGNCYPPSGERKGQYLMSYFFPPKNKVIIELHKIKQALWDAGYKIMALIIEKQLPSIIPFNEFPQDKIAIYNNNTITIFVPRDEAVSIKGWMRLEYQVVISKVAREDFYLGWLTSGSELLTLDINHNTLLVTDVPKYGHARINDVRITEWNIYNDRHVIVHGVEDFFDPNFPLTFPWTNSFLDDDIDLD